MVRIGKKLKGFNEGIYNIEQNREEAIKKNKNIEDIQVKPEKKECFDVSLIKKEIVEKQESPDDDDISLESYIHDTNIAQFFSLLLYKITLEKPENVCDFILKEITELMNLNERDVNQIEPKKEMTNYRHLLGEHQISLEELIDMIQFIKIENEDQIYFNRLKGILNILDNEENSKMLSKENIKITDTIPIQKANELVTNYYKNYFNSK